ncbi:phenylalanine--tRNA ligase beta subunit-related protein, partial [Acinetobacter baumannii]
VAYFDPAAIARTGQALALTSDARGRFERGVDPTFLDTGMDILTALILEICGGEASEVVRAGAAPVAARTVSYETALAGRLGGVDVADAEQRRILRA